MSIAGLSAADSAAYVRALSGDCDVAIQVLNLTLSHGLVSSINPVVLDGQVNVTAGDGQNITRTLQMGFLDPDHSLHLDSNSPSAGVGGLDRLLRVNTYVHTPELGRWIMAPAFTGRPSVIARDGDSVTVEAQGKECLHLRGVDAFTIGKGAYVLNAIRLILERGGETRFRFPTTASVRSRLPSVVHIGGTEEDRQPWRVAWTLARRLNLQLYYDAMGYACLRAYPAWSSPAWRLIERGEGANLLSRVKMSTDLTTIRNRVVVYGHTVATKKTRGHPARKSRLVRGEAFAPASHQHSAQSLVVNGRPWSNTAFYDEPTVNTEAAANAFAQARLVELLTEATEVETTTLPVWHLEPLDVLALSASSMATSFRLRDASIPLGPSDTGMTIGHQQRVRSPSAGRLRKR